MENETPEHDTEHLTPPSTGTPVHDVNTGGGHFIGRDVNTGGGHFIGRDIIIGGIKIPRAIVPFVVITLIIGLAGIGFIAFNTFAITGVVTAPTPTATATMPTATPTATPLAFATGTPNETLIVLATFHGEAAIEHEPHIKIRRAIASEAANHGEQQLRVEVEPTKLTADQRTQATTLGKRYNASMVIWGEDTGVEVVVNFLNLKEPNFDAGDVKVNTTEQNIQLANPDVYQRFITRDLPQQMSFFAFFAIGQLYSLNEEYPRAIARIEAAIGVLPPMATPEGLADAYFRLGWLYQQSPKQLDKAIADYDKAIELDLNNTLTYNNRGSAYYAQGDLVGAIADYDKAIELDPDYAFAYNNRGLAYYAQGDLVGAIADYDKAIELDSNNALAYYNRGNAYYAQGDLVAAIADYDKAIELDPNDAFAYNNRGIAYANQDDLVGAIADYDKAIKLDPDYAFAYYNRGNAYYAQGDLVAAIADYNKVVALDPNYEYAYNSLCWNYSLQGQPELALLHCQHAIELTPHPNYYDSQGLAHALLGDFPAAIADFQIFVDFLEALNDPVMSKYLEERKQWIAMLKAGNSPFTPAVLEALKQE